MSKKVYGKHRGMVINNIDPMQKARLLVQVPGVLGVGMSSWAMPCVPVAGPQMGVFVLPMIGAGVWIEFEGGDTDHPIWTGCFWGSAAEVPALGLASSKAPTPGIVLQTTMQNTIMASDLPGAAGGILLKSSTGATIMVNDTGIIIQNGKGASIIMTGKSVIINEGALLIN